MFEAVNADPKTSITVNLENQKVTLDTTGESENFDINPYKKENMLNGFDDIDYLLNLKEEIKEFSKNTPL